MTKAIHTREITMSFRARGRRSDVIAAVRGVNLDIGLGEMVGFLGPNGAGKTTLLRMLATLLRPTAGAATVLGFDLVNEPRAVRRHLGYVSQQGGTDPRSTVREELTLQARLHGLTRFDSRVRVAQLLDDFALGDAAEKQCGTLSGGQRRRVDIALGLVHRPDILILDEPTTGLDPRSRAALWDHIRIMHQQSGTTVLLTTHYLEEADALAGRLLIVDDGVVVADDSPAVLKSRLSEHRIVMGVPAVDRDAARELLARMPGVSEVAIEGELLEVRTDHAERILPHLMYALHEAAVPLDSLRVGHATLDDVFAALTGRTLGDAAVN
ncbi:ATP-binding cassette domain-containing protein [Streptomyces sp. NPDC046909]|uniref:ATP-binding cassette domain-containing protein n=1 Tax=Streptomyces sp. NPDC046909 TaxID=3155617 RepID=UPI0033F0D346